jgi:ABC-type lipoprotein release transport system permease subunit
MHGGSRVALIPVEVIIPSWLSAGLVSVADIDGLEDAEIAGGITFASPKSRILTVLASYVPAQRAARIDLAAALGTE